MKKLIVLIPVIIIAFALAGCGAGSGEELNIYNWGDYIGEDVIAQFEEETGIKVNYSTFASNEEMYAKIKSGAGDYDVIFPSDYMVERMINEDMLAEIDTASLAGYDLIDDKFKDMAYDPANSYSVPYMWGTVGILYNTSMVDEEVNSWEILWDEKYAGQIFMYDSARDTMMVALKMLGYDINTRNPDEIEAAKQLLIDQSPLVLAYITDDGKDKMIAGEAALAVVYSGDAMETIWENEDLAYAIPMEGSNIWVDAMVIPKSSKNYDNALKFIEFMCRTDIAFENVDYICYSTPQKEALAMVEDETMLGTSAFNPTAEEIARCEVFNDLGEFKSVYDDAWLRIKVQ